MSINYTHPAKLLVDTLQRIYDYGMTTTSGGNISIKDEKGNIWITPSGIDKGTLTPEDIMMVTPEGKIIGRHTPSCELPFHSAVYKLRPDARTVLHAHSPALVAFSLVGRTPDSSLVPGCEEVCGKIAFSRYDIPGSISLGEIISAEFARGADCVMMENHGAVVCGASIEEAFRRFENLDYIARIQIGMSGLKGALVPKESISAQKYEKFAHDYASPEECALRDSMKKFAVRIYKQRLGFAGGVALSAALSKDEFLITPEGFDPLAFDVSDAVLVKNGRCQDNGTPSIFAPLAEKLYAQDGDWAKAFITAKCPNLMAFACSGNALDSRMIPESYIQLRDMPKVSFAEFAADVTCLVKKITPATPVVIVENFGVIAVGKNLTQAFDRFEVSDFTANCILLAQRLGKVNSINQAQVDEIIEAFKLPR